VPELPEVETVRRGLENHLLGRVIIHIELRRNDLRFPFPKDLQSEIEGRKVLAIDRRAKYLLIRLENDITWLCHLGMSGRWTLLGEGKSGVPGRFAYGAELGSGNGPHDWVVIYLDDGGKGVYSDHRRFGIMDIMNTNEEKTHKLLKNIGPEPTPNSLTPKYLADKLRGRKISIKSALLDQKIIAGLGNIYVCEILNRSGISPKRTADSVVGKSIISKHINNIVFQTHSVMTEAIDAGGSTLQDFRGVDGDNSLGYFPSSFMVYGREGKNCLNIECDSKIKRIIQSNRSTFYCPKCQR
jgi:formamidopyrimidine-DNA glycosylase|tara:strand:+ start:409 stop:1302 length:894 start_codon:yes stop_codon:yes gene_type:complete